MTRDANISHQAYGGDIAAQASALYAQLSPQQQGQSFWRITRETWEILVRQLGHDPIHHDDVDRILRRGPMPGDILLGMRIEVVDGSDLYQPNTLYLVTTYTATWTSLHQEWMHAQSVATQVSLSEIREGIREHIEESLPYPSAWDHVNPHPQTQAINQEFGWENAHKMEFNREDDGWKNDPFPTSP
jgi:hypothetical protein